MNCRHCGFDLDRGDIYECLKYRSRTSPEEDLIDMARSFGWTPQYPKRFSKVVIVQDDATRTQVEICPECKGESPLTQGCGDKSPLTNLEETPLTTDCGDKSPLTSSDYEEEQEKETIWESLGIKEGDPKKYNLDYKWPSKPEPFTLTEEQYNKYYEWAQQFKDGNFGAIGGIFTFSFTPTTLGTILKVEHAEGKEIDLTEYDNW